MCYFEAFLLIEMRYLAIKFSFILTYLAFCRCLITGLFTNVAERQPNKVFKTLSSRQDVKIHSSSTLFGLTGGYVLYSELLNTGTTNFMNNLSQVEPGWLVENHWDYFRDRHIRPESYMYNPKITKKIEDNKKQATDTIN